MTKSTIESKDENAARPAPSAKANDTLAPSLLDTTHDLHHLLDLLQKRTGHDFKSYKRKTLLRRIERRMAVNGVKELGEYVRILNKKAEEAQVLAQEFLISVTSFFRDPQAFELLQEKIIPNLCAKRETDEPLRIWHACCATGEEAYSVAMLVLEHLDKEVLPAKVLLFATDLDEVAIAQARAGLYSDEDISELSEERLQRFFTKTEDRWQVSKQLREMIVFAHHNIIKDPPFSRLDLLVCRNFLIYLNVDFQKLLIPLFHQVLKPGGYLFLGAAETVGPHSDLFTPINATWKIFGRQGGTTRIEMLLPFSGPVRRLKDMEDAARASETPEFTTIAHADKLLLERYAPVRILINERHEVVHFSSRAGDYLLTPEGKPTSNLLKIAKEELRPALRAAIYKAFTDQKEIVYRGIKVLADTGATTVDIIVIPLKDQPPADKLAAVIIGAASPSPIQPSLSEAASDSNTARNSIIYHLEEQLRVTAEQLQSTTEQLETANERFLLANEELMTVNEELQSSNEELQSTNEELVTVNSELQRKMEELSQSNSDLHNLFASSQIATIFLDRQLLIKRFSPAMATLLKLLPADIDRPAHHLNSTIDWSNLESDAATVLDNLQPIEREVNSSNGRSYIMRVLPYRTTKGVVDGIVVTLIDITERKRGEEALRLYELLSQNSRDIILFIRYEDGRILEANAAALQTYGYSHEEMVQMTVKDLRAPDTQHLTATQMLEAIKEGVLFETTHRRKDGTKLLVDVRSQGGFIGDKQILVSVVRDITDLKHKEDALRQSELQYRTLFDTMIEGFCTIEMIFDGDGRPVNYRFIETNPAFEKQTGLKNVQGKLIRDLAPDNEEYWYEIYGKVALTGKPTRFESQAMALGSHYEVCAYRIGGPESKKVAILCNNITERKRAEEDLRRSEQRRSMALEAALAGTWEWDLATNLNIWSDELWHLYGLEKFSCQPSYTEWQRLVHPDDLPKTEQMVKDAVCRSMDFNIEWRLKHSDGSERWLMSRGRPVKDAHGRVVQYLGTVIDITERRRTEETNKVLHSQLVHAQKMEAIGTLAGGIAHDFNNILSAVLGYSDMVREDSLTQSVKTRDVEQIIKAGQRAKDLVQQILAFSRQASTSKILIKPKNIICEAIKLLRASLPTTISIEQDIAADVGNIIADPIQIHQIVMNLCTNSFHAMEVEGGTLTICLKKTVLKQEDILDKPHLWIGQFLQLSIKDTGAGIAPDIQQKIFEPYFTTKEVGKGTGMGLAMVHGIVQNLGGSISLESRIGEGTHFSILLPVVETAPVPGLEATALIPGGEEHILFIDDEEILNEMGKIMLERLGYRVTASNNSTEALAFFAQQPETIDLVITDMTMPGMTGIELAQRILQIRPEMPIILCTGYSSLISEERAKSLGIKGFALKPMAKKDISTIIREVLEVATIQQN